MDLYQTPPVPAWDEEGATIDMHHVDATITDVLLNWGIEIDWTEGDVAEQIADQIGTAEAVEYSEVYNLIRDIAYAVYADENKSNA